MGRDQGTCPQTNKLRKYNKDVFSGNELSHLLEINDLAFLTTNNELVFECNLSQINPKGRLQTRLGRAIARDFTGWERASGWAAASLWRQSVRATQTGSPVPMNQVGAVPRRWETADMEKDVFRGNELSYLLQKDYLAVLRARNELLFGA